MNWLKITTIINGLFCILAFFYSDALAVLPFVIAQLILMSGISEKRNYLFILSIFMFMANIVVESGIDMVYWAIIGALSLVMEDK